MFKKRKKQKKFTREMSLKEGDAGGFVLRITESRVDIETKAKDWKITFAAGTYEYQFIFYLLLQKPIDLQSLHQLAVVLFAVRTVFRYSELIPKIEKLVRTTIKASAKKKAEEQSDEEILAEQKVLHLGTQESVEELEAIKAKKQ